MLPKCRLLTLRCCRPWTPFKATRWFPRVLGRFPRDLKKSEGCNCSAHEWLLAYRVDSGVYKSRGSADSQIRPIFQTVHSQPQTQWFTAQLQTWSSVLPSSGPSLWVSAAASGSFWGSAGGKKKINNYIICQVWDLSYFMLCVRNTADDTRSGFGEQWKKDFIWILTS